jgi:hypothetical protein
VLCLSRACVAANNIPTQMHDPWHRKSRNHKLQIGRNSIVLQKELLASDGRRSTNADHLAFKRCRDKRQEICISSCSNGLERQGFVPCKAVSEMRKKRCKKYRVWVSQHTNNAGCGKVMADLSYAQKQVNTAWRSRMKICNDLTC